MTDYQSAAHLYLMGTIAFISCHLLFCGSIFVALGVLKSKCAQRLFFVEEAFDKKILTRAHQRDCLAPNSNFGRSYVAYPYKRR